MCRTELKDIDFDLGVILVHGKGGNERYVPFGSFAAEAVEAYVKLSRTSFDEKHRTFDFCSSISVEVR